MTQPAPTDTTADDPAIVIDDPERIFDLPFYEGPVSFLHQLFDPGTYHARLESTGQYVAVQVTTTASVLLPVTDH